MQIELLPVKSGYDRHIHQFYIIKIVTPYWSDNASASVYFLKDHLGSTRGLMTADGQLLGEISYDSFGKPQGTGVNDTRYLYTGREYDADTELYVLLPRQMVRPAGKKIHKRRPYRP